MTHVSGSGNGALLPDPEPRARTYTVISVDDHLIEPPDLFEGRMPAALAERAPQIVTADDEEPPAGQVHRAPLSARTCTGRVEA